MITATYDFDSGWSFTGDPDIKFAVSFVDKNADRIYPESFSFGWQSGGLAHLWPPANAVVKEMASGRVFEFSVDAEPDDEIILSVWVRHSGEIFSSETKWFIPRPPQTYPSWTWQDGKWVAPVPYPGSDEEDYFWDEESLSWATVTPISDQGDS